MMELRHDEQAMLDGAQGEGAALAMRVVLVAARALGARALRPITRAHVDGCLYHGRASLDFAGRLRDGNARVAVPTTLNVGMVDLLHPELNRGDPAERVAARSLMDAYVALGCEPTFTCAPYQLRDRPALGEQIVWAESNAIVFANSVLGARTNRYGDFVDVCAAITGRAPDAGLHRDEARAARLVFDVSGLPEPVRTSELLPPLLGHLLGRRCGSAVPAIVGLPERLGEDDLKALGAAAASSGSVAMFHAVGLTPEAPTLAAALHEREPEAVVEVTVRDLEAARAELARDARGRLSAISVGTPHASPRELRRLAELLDGRRISGDVDFYVSTHRAALAACPDAVGAIRESGVELVVDTCTYIAPVMRRATGVVMTNSAKWAYYAPANLGVDVAFGTLADCVRSGVAGELVQEARW
jgi:predicted aconitase